MTRGAGIEGAGTYRSPSRQHLPACVADLQPSSANNYTGETTQDRQHGVTLANYPTMLLGDLYSGTDSEEFTAATNISAKEVEV